MFLFYVYWKEDYKKIYEKIENKNNDIKPRVLVWSFLVSNKHTEDGYDTYGWNHLTKDRGKNLWHMKYRYAI